MISALQEKCEKSTGSDDGWAKFQVNTVVCDGMQIDL